MNRLELLNERRVALGKLALKSWKGSKAALEEAITALGHAMPKDEKPRPKPKPLPRIARSLGIHPKERTRCIAQITRRCVEVAERR